MHDVKSETKLAATAAVVRAQGAEGWLVGGSVRDRELGRFSPDLDVVVTGDAYAVARGLSRALDLPWFALSQKHGAFRVVGESVHVDVAAVRGGGILADLGERDFTINAMALPLEGGELIDPFGGLSDLRERRLRAVSDHIFDDDPLRLMRTARFAHVLTLDLDPALSAAVRQQVGDVRLAAAERVATEMILTLDAGRSGDAARLWDDLGLLRAVAPESALGAAESRTRLLDRLEQSLSAPAGAFPEAGESLARRLTSAVDGAIGRSTAVRLAGLFRATDPAGAAGLARRLRLSHSVMTLVEKAARMARWGELPAVLPGGGPGREAVEFLWAAAPWEAEVILLAAADGAAGAEALMSLWARRDGGDTPRLPFDGDGLMEELALEPGPRLGAALRAARLAWEAGEATTTEQALAAALAAT